MAGTPTKPSTDSESLAMEANVKSTYVECVTSIQQSRDAALTPPPSTPPVTDTTNEQV